MLKERPALGGDADFISLNVRPHTKRLIEALADKLHWKKFEVVHALVVAEARAQGLKEDSR
jgi:hypothetical protein